MVGAVSQRLVGQAKVVVRDLLHRPVAGVVEEAPGCCRVVEADHHRCRSAGHPRRLRSRSPPPGPRRRASSAAASPGAGTHCGTGRRRRLHQPEVCSHHMSSGAAAGNTGTICRAPGVTAASTAESRRLAHHPSALPGPVGTSPTVGQRPIVGCRKPVIGPRSPALDRDDDLERHATSRATRGQVGADVERVTRGACAWPPARQRALGCGLCR